MGQILVLGWTSWHEAADTVLDFCDTLYTSKSVPHLAVAMLKLCRNLFQNSAGNFGVTLSCKQKFGAAFLSNYSSVFNHALFKQQFETGDTILEDIQPPMELLAALKPQQNLGP